MRKPLPKLETITDLFEWSKNPTCKRCRYNDVIVKHNKNSISAFYGNRRIITVVLGDNIYTTVLILHRAAMSLKT